MRIIKIQPGTDLIKIAGGEPVFLFDDATAVPALRIEVSPGASLDYLFFFDPSGPEAYEGRREMVIADGASVRVRRAYLGSGDCRLTQTVDLDSRIALDQQSFFFIRDSQKLHIEEKNIFRGAGSTGRFRGEGMVGGRAQAEFRSEISIEQAAQDTDSRIDLRLNLLDPTARGLMLPALRIAANRVKAGHGASTFQLGDEELFYLGTRGLDESHARALVIRSAAEQFAAGIAVSEFRDKVLDAIKIRL